jgi:hypothetical protein
MRDFCSGLSTEVVEIGCYLDRQAECRELGEIERSVSWGQGFAKQKRETRSNLFPLEVMMVKFRSVIRVCQSEKGSIDYLRVSESRCLLVRSRYS